MQVCVCVCVVFMFCEGGGKAECKDRMCVCKHASGYALRCCSPLPRWTISPLSVSGKGFCQLLIYPSSTWPNAASCPNGNWFTCTATCVSQTLMGRQMGRQKGRIQLQAGFGQNICTVKKCKFSPNGQISLEGAKFSMQRVKFGLKSEADGEPGRI